MRNLPVLLLCTVTACSSGSPVPDATPDSPQPIPAAVDLLLVVDTSESMAQEQRGLVDCCPAGILPFINLPGGMPDLRVGLITANLGGPGSGVDCSANGDQATLLSTGAAGCPNEGWLEGTPTDSNIPGCTDGAQCLNDALSKCIGYPSPKGCSFSQPLEAARRFLQREKSKSNGFIRNNAVLAVVFVADEDDCSAKDPSFFAQDPTLGPVSTFRCFEHGVTCTNEPADRSAPGVRNGCQPSGDKLTPVKDYVDFLKSLKPEGQVIVGAIAGPTEHIEVVKGSDGVSSLAKSCTNIYGVAVPTIRLKKVTEAFGRASFFTSICDRFWFETAFLFAANTYANL